MSIRTFILYSSSLGLVSSFPSLSNSDSALAFTSRSSTEWSMPPHFTDISTVFNVTKFHDDQRNIQIVEQLPSNAQEHALDSQASAQDLVQIFYPKGSINPKNKILGGTEFYASPIDISTAENVTLSYSALFEKDFQFTKGGKMPGLYGGHEDCSGGRSAHTCFSTRLMWRMKGAGELYLYAPKRKQSPDLCSSPGSVCHSTYGMSIGRRSFHWTPGKWTEISQTVKLNTPGRHDGSFTLEVNGDRVIERHDLFYRDVGQESARRRREDQHLPALEDFISDESEDGTLNDDQELPSDVFVVKPRAPPASGADPVGFSGLFFRYDTQIAVVNCAYQ
ncbi:hypothetical protein VNI00_011071 [Paramarasmius palmivorus]|uniref:Polysaccharide lyase 14 domain-containing protein n=1 Tax=Paramarasmius palmivorus TaxID=297713 RepID=A0AAW0CG17_9AGAR